MKLSTFLPVALSVITTCLTSPSSAYALGSAQAASITSNIDTSIQNELQAQSKAQVSAPKKNQLVGELVDLLILHSEDYENNFLDKFIKDFVGGFRHFMPNLTDELIEDIGVEVRKLVKAELAGQGGFNRLILIPSYAQALTDEQVATLIAHVEEYGRSSVYMIDRNPQFEPIKERIQVSMENNLVRFFSTIEPKIVEVVGARLDAEIVKN